MEHTTTTQERTMFTLTGMTTDELRDEIDAREGDLADTLAVYGYGSPQADTATRALDRAIDELHERPDGREDYDYDDDGDRAFDCAGDR
jgi:hypothetical protein